MTWALLLNWPGSDHDDLATHTSLKSSTTVRTRMYFPLTWGYQAISWEVTDLFIGKLYCPTDGWEWRPYSVETAIYFHWHKNVGSYSIEGLRSYSMEGISRKSGSYSTSPYQLYSVVWILRYTIHTTMEAAILDTSCARVTFCEYLARSRRAGCQR